jgi:DNA polymerase-2
MKAFIVYPTYTTINEENYIQLFGRLDNGESFVATTKFEPYFFIEDIDLSKVKKILEKQKIKPEKTTLTNFQDKKVLKIPCLNQAQLNKVRHDIHGKKVHTYEGDIKPPYRFMIDKGLLGTIEISGHYETSERVDRVYENPELKNAEFIPDLKIVSVDIETNINMKKLYCIGLHSDNYKKCFMVTKKKNLKNIVPCKDEAECLEKFKQAFIELDPDIVTGWHVIDFDFNHLRKLFIKNKIPFDLGRTTHNAKIRIQDNFFRSSSMDIPGRLVLDGLNFIRDPFIKEAPTIKHAKFESYSLENVSQELLKKGKIINGKEGKGKEIESLYKNNQQKLGDYNLLDCQLVYEILEKTDIISLAIERSQLTGLPLDKIGGSIASFDSLYIREARKKGLVSPTTKFEEKPERIKGGFVMSPKPGIYENVLVFDFKSLYPSIIRTFNIDPASYLEKKESGCIQAPNKACFKNQEGILPDIIEKLHHARERAKKNKRELASYAIKIIMNSFFGVLASPNCRYFNLNMGNAITSFGQELIKLTSKKIQESNKDLEVIYGDTDSIFVNTNLNKQKATQLGHEIEKQINSFYDKYVQKGYKRKSFLELEFEKLYLSLMMPAIRGGQGGAKKRYAGLKEVGGKEVIEIVGLEAIRGDWTQAAQEFQRELLDKVFHKQSPSRFIKSYIADLRAGKLDDKLVYKKSIRKNLAEYTKTTPPHVKAARKLDSIDSTTIRYYITTDGPEPIQKLKHSIDYEHYIKKQIEPIAKTILNLFDIKFEDVLKGSKQATLF